METGQDARAKRKRDLLYPATDDRPSKRASPDVSYQTAAAAATTTRANGKMSRRQDSTQANNTYDSENDDMDSQAGSSELSEVGPIVSAVAGADSAEWQATIEAVVKNVVSIHFCQTCAFDTDGACSSEATGFVVDAERGYILTNRHVVGAGPFSGFCIFDNYEEVDVHPVYRDPVHDFGILRFDPKAVKYMPLKSLELRPDLAKVGVEIRVVGNDAGEKLSILSGVISRMDRNAPEYGEGYSDFNTNYIQAAAAASGGSSGSPVVNLDGYAVALQAGGRADGAATDYFLPLDRPLRALKCIQEGKPISRGTIQTQWLMKAYDECRRLGLSSEWESELRTRFPKVNSLLVAEIVLPEGPASSHIQPGDVLIKVNGELLTQLIRLDDILDSHVGKSVRILVQRGGEDIEFEVDVGDLHAITPDRFVTVSGASFHDLSYQQARLHAVAVKGLFVCEAGGSYRFDGADAGWIIESVDRKPTPNLKSFIDVVQGIPDRARVVVTYKHLRDLHTLNTVIILVDRHWSSMMRMAVRNDETGLWDFTDLADPLPAVKPAPLQADFPSLESSSFSAASDIIKSIVRISCVIPLKLDGFPRARRIGHGLVIDADKGLVLVSRATVPYDLCDISITVADSIILDAKVIFLHPLANYAILQYDPSIVLAPVKTAKLSTTPMKQGQSTTFIGFNQNLRVVIAKTTVTDITTVAIPQNGSAPRYRALNLDAITVDTGLSGQCGSGVLVKDDGTVDALWMTYLGERSSSSNKDVEYHLGLDAANLLSVVEQIRQGQIPELRILPMEASTIHMSQARIMGVPDEVITQVTKANPARHQLFMVRKVDSPVPQTAKDGASSSMDVDANAEQQFMEGDIILTLNGKLITRVSELDIMYNEEKLSAVIVRKGQQLSLTIPTIPTRDVNTTHAVIFCGAVIHKPHHAVRQQISKIHSGVYISGRARGSPASMYGLAPTNFITAVNSVPTPTLEEFITETRKIPDNTYFRLRVVTFDNVEWVATMKKNEHYFPAMEFIRKDDGTWEKRKIDSVVVAGSDEANDTTGVGEPPVQAVDDIGVDMDVPGEGFDN